MTAGSDGAPESQKPIDNTNQRRKNFSWEHTLRSILNFIWTGSQQADLRIPKAALRPVQGILDEYRDKYIKESESFRKEKDKLSSNNQKLVKEIESLRENSSKEIAKYRALENRASELENKIREKDQHINNLALELVKQKGNLSALEQDNKRLRNLNESQAEEFRNTKQSVVVIHQKLTRHLRELAEQKERMLRAPWLMTQTNSSQGSGRPEGSATTEEKGRLNAQKRTSSTAERQLLLAQRQEILRLGERLQVEEQGREHAEIALVACHQANSIDRRLLREAIDRLADCSRSEIVRAHELMLLRTEAQVLRRALRQLGREHLRLRSALAAAHQHSLSIQREITDKITIGQQVFELRKNLQRVASKLAESRANRQQSMSEYIGVQRWTRPEASIDILRVQQKASKSREEAVELRAQLVKFKIEADELAYVLNRRTYLILFFLILGFVVGNWNHLVAGFRALSVLGFVDASH